MHDSLRLLRPGDWLRLMRPGDWLLTLAAAAAVAFSWTLLWSGDGPQRAIIRLDGVVLAELSLAAPRLYSVEGPLGETVIEIARGRARVLSDPGPRQYCVRQGWLSHANAIAVCAPNRVTLSLGGDGGPDTIGY